MPVGQITWRDCAALLPGVGPCSLKAPARKY
jgi:hypothetical protein